MTKIDKFIEDHIVLDEIDGIERTLVEFNFNDWIRFKRDNFDKEDDLKDSEQTTHLDITDPEAIKAIKNLEKEFQKPKRKRRTKAEMIADGKKNTEEEIIKFISKSKTTNVLVLRDKIIEKFEVDFPIIKIREAMKKDIPGEEVDDEVKRIKEKRKKEEFKYDEDIDELDLDE